MSSCFTHADRANVYEHNLSLCTQPFDVDPTSVKHPDKLSTLSTSLKCQQSSSNYTHTCLSLLIVVHHLTDVGLYGYLTHPCIYYTQKFNVTSVQVPQLNFKATFTLVITRTDICHVRTSIVQILPYLVMFNFMPYCTSQAVVGYFDVSFMHHCSNPVRPMMLWLCLLNCIFSSISVLAQWRRQHIGNKPSFIYKSPLQSVQVNTYSFITKTFIVAGVADYPI